MFSSEKRCDSLLNAISCHGENAESESLPGSTCKTEYVGLAATPRLVESIRLKARQARTPKNQASSLRGQSRNPYRERACPGPMPAGTASVILLYRPDLPLGAGCAVPAT